MFSKTELSELYRKRQAEMQKLYDSRTTAGKKMEIPWKDHLPVRVIINEPRKRRKEKVPYFINAHGGGFVEGDAVTMDSYCQMLADELGILVVNLNYRLSPEYVYDYQLREIDVVHRYIYENQDILGVDPSKCGIGGFSAGATLSISSIVRSIIEGSNRYRCCVLGYPMTSALPGAIDPNDPYQPGDAEMMAAIYIYFNGAEADPVCSPLIADKEILKQFPATVLFTCKNDALGKQGREFAARLTECGIRLNFAEFKNALHGFLEVNRPDYFLDDPRKTPEQMEITKKAEKLIVSSLSEMLYE